MSKSKKITELDKLSNAKETDLIPVARDSEPNGDNSIAIGSIIKYNSERHIVTILGKVSFDITPLMRHIVNVENEIYGHVLLDGVEFNSGNFLYGQILNFTAVPDDGYELTAWKINDTVVGQDSTYSLTVTDDVTIYAIYEEIAKVTITAAVKSGQSNYGQAYIKIGETSYENIQLEVGSQFTLKAIPDHQNGYAFEKWTDGTNEYADAEKNLTASSNANYIASFKLRRIDFSVVSNNTDWGTVSIDNYIETRIEVNYGTPLTLRATANTRYVFDKWDSPLLIPDLGSDNPLTYEVNPPLSNIISIRANFKHIGLYDFYYKTYNKPSQGYIVDGITSFDGMDHVDHEDLENEDFEQFGTMKAVKGVANNNQVYVIFFDSSKFDKVAFKNQNALYFDIDNDFSDTDIYHCGTKIINNKTFGFIELVLYRTEDKRHYAVGFSTIQ